MSREIKFRAQSIVVVEGDPDIEEGDWVYGSLIVDKPESYIINGVVESTDEYISIENWCPINIETAGQYTGLKDRHGVEIYEGDVITVPTGLTDRIEAAPILFERGGFVIQVPNFFGNPSLSECLATFDLSVIGNIYDDPELLKEVV